MGFERETHQSVSESLGIVADWMGAMLGNGRMPDVLERLTKLSQADAALIVRTSKPDNTLRYIARCDNQTGKVWHAPAQSYAAAIMGNSQYSSKAGSVWKLSEFQKTDLHQPSDEIMTEFDRDVLREVVVVQLETENTHADNLELHFRQVPAQHNLNLISMLTSTLSSCWRRRMPGVMAKRLVRTRLREVSAQSESDDLSILDINNPAQLSRSEFRVCTLLNEGMTVRVIADSLSVCQATVRSHLSSIFSKTGTCSQLELLKQLNRTSREPSAKAV